MKVSELLALLRADGWQLKTTKGSHRQFVHPTKRGKVTVAGKESTVLPPKTEATILKQAGLQKPQAKKKGK